MIKLETLYREHSDLLIIHGLSMQGALDSTICRPLQVRIEKAKKSCISAQHIRRDKQYVPFSDVGIIIHNGNLISLNAEEAGTNSQIQKMKDKNILAEMEVIYSGQYDEVYKTNMWSEFKISDIEIRGLYFNKDRNHSFYTCEEIFKTSEAYNFEYIYEIDFISGKISKIKQNSHES